MPEKKAELDELECQAELFDLPPFPVYLSGASRSPKLKASCVEGMAGIQRQTQTPWAIGDDGCEEQARALFAELIDATADDIAITPSCSYAISLCAHNIERAGRD